MPRPQPVLFVSHGAAVFTTAPGDPTHDFLASLAARVESWAPRAIVVISAHFREAVLTTTGDGPLETVHDHPARRVHGFAWPAHGSAELRTRVHALLQAAGRPVHTDVGRGLDHGAWVPLSLLHPAAELPVLALSLAPSDDPAEHLAVGRALAPLRDEGVLIVGSGGVTHDQGEFRRSYFAGDDPRSARPFSTEFAAWVRDVLTTATGSERLRALSDFRAHPRAREAHPTIEHFLPLLVVAGAAANAPATELFAGFQHSLSTAAYLFDSADGRAPDLEVTGALDAPGRAEAE